MITKCFLLSLLVFWGITAKGQKYTPCEVTTQTGSVIEGSIKRYHPGYDLAHGFKLVNAKKQKMKINPAYAKKVEVGSDTHRAHLNQKGKPVFMHRVVSGPKANLYRYSIKMTSGIPGEGLSTWYVNEHYLEREGTITFVEEKDLLQHPEVYFPNAPQLTALIQTKKKERDSLGRLGQAIQ
ncbi:hypothetical protein FGF1_14940 [Flavobacteriaceae bacterium GF1]